jgi:hypothetical protein
MASIIEARADAFEVADTIAVRVLKRARIDLIYDAAFPPDCHYAKSLHRTAAPADRRETGPSPVENNDWATYLETSG